MRVRSGKSSFYLLVTVTTALCGCQTANTASESAGARLATRFATPPSAVVRGDARDIAAAPTESTVQSVTQVASVGARSADPLDGTDNPDRPRVADFMLATVVPAVPNATNPTSASATSGSATAPTVPATPGPGTPTPLMASVPPEPAGLGSAGAQTVQLTLDAAIATSLDRNDTLVTLRAGEPVAQAMLDVANHYPYNPYIKAEILPYARDPFGNLLAVRNTVYVLQSLELAHQQRYREASASAALNQVRWNLVAAELTNVATTEKLFFTALYQRDLRDLALRTASLTEQLAADVERRKQAALSKPGEDITANVSLRQSRKQAELAETNYRLALLTLKRQLNAPDERPLELVGRLEDFGWSSIEGMGSAPGALQSSAQLAETLADERPDVRAAQAGANVAQSNADLARANVVQNIQFGPYYERDEFETVFFGFAAQMTLPIWDSGRPLARQREAECSQRVVGLNALRARARVEVQTALERYDRARALAEKERPNLAQSLSGDLARVKRQFDAGQADILNVFATQTGLLQEQKAYLDLLNELGQAAADVTLSAGLPPARVASGPRTDAAAVPAPPAAP
jgi:cobalt-zinc-cadmium efflux system outer membrane protein